MEHAELISRTNSVISELDPVTRNLASSKSEIELALANLTRYEKIIDKIRPLESTLPILEGFEVTVLLIRRNSRTCSKSSGVTHRYHQETVRTDLRDVDESTLAAVTIFNKKYSEQVHSFLFTQNVNEIRLPPSTWESLFPRFTP